MTQSLAARAANLESILDSSRVLSDPAALAHYAIHDIAPAVAAKPATPEEAAAVVRYAAAEKLAVIPSGCHSKLQMGATPSRYDIALDMNGIREIAHYDPADLTISVGAGMPLAALNATLFQHNQFLPLLVPCYSSATVGGAIASGLDSPLRQFYGTARDFLLGAEFIDGTGALVKSGGRVVKNVTGYDLHKMLVGSMGNLAAITRLNFRTFPAPVAGSRGFVASFSTHEAALALRNKIAASPLAPLTLDLLNPAAAQIFATRTPSTLEVPVFAGENHNTQRQPLPLPADWFRRDAWQVCAAFAGVPAVLDRCSRDLTRFAEEASATSATFLDDSTRPSIWGRLREALPLFLESSPHATIFRLSLVPGYHQKAITLLEAVANAADIPLALIARASGPLYVALLPASTNGLVLDNLLLFAHEVVTLSRSRAGDASMLFAPPNLRSRFAHAIAATSGVNHSAEPEAIGSSTAVLFNTANSPSFIARRIKSAFDPQAIFSPGRLL
jgi:glycolate oxidase FAD binding subunit